MIKLTEDQKNMILEIFEKDPNILNITKSHLGQFIIGIIFIYLLDLSVNYLSCSYIKYYENFKNN